MMITAKAESLEIHQKESNMRKSFVRDGMKTPTEDDTTSQIRAETNSQRQPRE